MNELFAQIKELRPHWHGWATEKKACTLAAMVVALRPKLIVEIGVWGGSSFLPMAMACKYLKHGKVIGIDPWSAAASVQGMDPINKDWWGKADHEKIYQCFMQEVRELELEPYVQIERVISDEAAVPPRINLVHLDGNHGDQAYKDAERFVPNVEPGGFVVLDDLRWSGDGVARAIELVSQYCWEQYRELEPPNDWGVFVRV